MRPRLGHTSRFRYTLGQWMVLNVYLAIILAMVVLVASVEDPVDFVFALALGSFWLPLILRFVTMLLLRSGPRRDALAIVFGGLWLVTSAFWAALFAFAVLRDPVALGPAMTRGKILCVLIPAVLLAGIGVLRDFRSELKGRCPSCRRWRLVHPQSVPRATWRRVLLFEFAWCAACRSRWKRNRKAPTWSDASDPAYDEWFGLRAPVTIRHRLDDAL
jgi:hypothetical protein